MQNNKTVLENRLARLPAPVKRASVPASDASARAKGLGGLAPDQTEADTARHNMPAAAAAEAADADSAVWLALFRSAFLIHRFSSTPPPPAPL